MGDKLIDIITSNLAIALVLGVLISLVLGPITIPILRRLKFGQNIRKEGPKSHLKKAGTPTMGGVIFLLSTTITMIVMRFNPTDEAMIALYSFIAFGFIGFLDDMLKIIKKESEGLKAWQKMLLLLIFSTAIAIYGYYNLGTNLKIPFIGTEIPLGILYIPFVIVYYAATTNAVNLTDGLDGLASTVTVLVLTFFTVVAFTMKQNSIAIFSIALIGGLLGFLKYNAYPARVFMGDTGSLALGGAIATIALVLELPLILFIVGGIYVIETLSVILQVGSYKLRGKRLFKMAPIHHHFEQVGWNETKIVTIFSVITVILCFIGFIAL
ncbi:phospho-N-acetylmuramoyl-pentapeptide-transferase [Clostridium chauvoei]|uniref:Phospho-N-acetylmuramoyl-pentapeptide-transferase n=2 Tax=Clostridium chauvoei TaxID=46867 RepID=S6EZY9_9CLOT|nr:phospho-N-acetylmuramoyl-pentapeptide-transferase [Clostridium chauvoei]ATD55226.1 phospho-N-acetylmuramoyl-pentapeptide-transferase [Clostridium chauvoei]ATD57102.1 phospho-N-acetylmuramoyl-pentapeptide-transferase [Clostridium chauvoei]MBX7279570.1 phospho-N-acetylmuramoyl-pentapeptide-transferase [Clostridium chauvoei]MBX7281939.1 phospho-N-acetylmuramoyl-pentapeptide-transferase [Clostridium chauvoei]MBX7284472.1 phospho-N-acetylmuramoyl-pentapeptide-transferase [Clostridium chauvoei]